MYFFQLSCFGFLCAVAALVQGEENRPRTTGRGSPRVLTSDFLDDLRAEVRSNHPTVAAAQAKAEAARAAVREIRLWDDPTLGLSVMAARKSMRQDEGDVMVSAEQMLPRRGLFQAKRDKALALQAVREAETQVMLVELETMVAQSALELALADEVVGVQAEQLAWLERMAANAKQRLADPAANAAEPLKIESESAVARQKLVAARAERSSLARQLNTILGRASNQPWPEFMLPAAPITGRTLMTMLDKLSTTNPQLRALSRTIAVAGAEVAVSEKERAPTFSIGTESAFYSEGDFRQTTFGVKLSLPWFNDPAYRAGAERARLEQTAAAREREAAERRLRGEIIAAFSRAEIAAHQAASQSAEVIPSAHKAAEAIESAWISSRASLLEVIEARRSWLTARLEQRRLVAAQRAALETLRSLVPPPSVKP